MKRMNRARKNVALSIVTLGTVLATGTTAFAAEPVASVDVSDGSSEPTATNVDDAGVVDALVGLATTTVGVLNGEATPQVDGNESGGVNIVLDPGSVPGLKEAFAPQGKSLWTHHEARQGLRGQYSGLSYLRHPYLRLRPALGHHAQRHRRSKLRGHPDCGGHGRHRHQLRASTGLWQLDPHPAR